MECAKLVLDYFRVFVWPLTALLILFVFRRHIISLINRIQKANLPGGISIETFPNQIEVAKDLSKEIKDEGINIPEEKRKHPIIPLTEANTRMLNLGLAPSSSGLEISYYQNLVNQDPNLALSGLRMETETMLKNLAKGNGISVGKKDSAGIIAKKLREKSKISMKQSELIRIILDLCNKAVHGYKVTKSEASQILDIAEVLMEQYVSWLSWGFPNDKIS